MDELRAGLELANEEELQALTDVLFRRKFNPLDYFCTPKPLMVQSRERQQWLDALEERFRFLAADGMTVLRGQARAITYRQVLIQVCCYLKLSYSEQFSTTDLEAEIFLYLLGRAWKRLPVREKQILTGRVQRSLSQSQFAPEIAEAVHPDPVGLILKGSSALAVSSVIRPWLLQQIAQQFSIHAATYQVARQTLARGGAVVAAQVESRVALHTASRGMAINAARYGAVRSLFAFVGPALWAWFLADLGWRTIATNYGRIIPVVFAIAQIRLTRADSWQPA